MSIVTIEVTTRDGAQHAVAAETDKPLMEALRNLGLVEALCGGEAACATCHVHIDDQWLALTGPPGEQEADMLDTSLEKRPNSRLSCQIVVRNDMDGMPLRIAQAEG